MGLQAEKLIETVRKHDILYVSTSKWYKDNKQKESAWRDVAHELDMDDKEGGHWDITLSYLHLSYVLTVVWLNNWSSEVMAYYYWLRKRCF